MSSKLKQKTNKTASSKESLEDSIYNSNNKKNGELPFELKASNNIFFFSPKIIIFAFLCGIMVALSESFEFLQKLNYLFPVRESSSKAIYFSVISVIGFGVLFFPDSYFKRPHKVFWRFILAAALCYLSLLVFVLFHSREDVLGFLHDVDHNLGKPLPEKHYAEDCRIYTPENPASNFKNLSDALDVYIIAHLLGWWVKMLIVRNWKFCFFLSMFFEFLEITFRHWLPNFYECWWDHIIIDIILCNGLGILLGEMTVKYYNLKRYNWFSNAKNELATKNTFVQNFKELFTTRDLKKHEWIMMRSLEKFFAILWYISFMSLVDLSNFFNKFVLWIPASHIILQLRVYLWGLIAMSSTREYYEYIFESGEIKSHCWLCHLMLFVEYCILFKFSKTFFDEPAPFYVKALWVMILANIIFFIGLIIFKKVQSSKKATHKK